MKLQKSQSLLIKSLILFDLICLGLLIFYMSKGLLITVVILKLVLSFTLFIINKYFLVFEGILQMKGLASKLNSRLSVLDGQISG